MPAIRVLLVEDEAKLRRVLTLQLQGSGYDVVQSTFAEEALKLSERADIIVTDLKLQSTL